MKRLIWSVPIWLHRIRTAWRIVFCPTIYNTVRVNEATGKEEDLTSPREWCRFRLSEHEGEENGCQIIALAHALDISYARAKAMLVAKGWKPEETGARIEGILHDLGWSSFKGFPSGLAGNCAAKRAVVISRVEYVPKTHHVSAVINGELVDQHDTRRYVIVGIMVPPDKGFDPYDLVLEEEKETFRFSGEYLTDAEVDIPEVLRKVALTLNLNTKGNA